MNPEEKKMGIKGSSTRQIFFNDVQVPVENLLYERGRIQDRRQHPQHRPHQAGGVVIGSCKTRITESVKYANARSSLGAPSASTAPSATSSAKWPSRLTP